MMKKMVMMSSLFLLLFVAACSQLGGTSVIAPTPVITHTPIAQQTSVTPTLTVRQPIVTPTITQPAASPTMNTTEYAGKVGGTSSSINLNNKGDNLTTILSIEDGDAVQFTQTTLNVPPKAKGEVYIQNASSHDQTIVSDTANGFAPFLVAPHTTVSLDFYRKGTFKAHLKGEAVSPYTSLTISILIPYSG